MNHLYDNLNTLPVTMDDTKLCELVDTYQATMHFSAPGIDGFKRAAERIVTGENHSIRRAVRLLMPQARRPQFFEVLLADMDAKVRAPDQSFRLTI